MKKKRNYIITKQSNQEVKAQFVGLKKNIPKGWNIIGCIGCKLSLYVPIIYSSDLSVYRSEES